ncbi:MAG: protein kinase, partial [Polyangiaceae bacterium]|nr:protein kinase [Polyangiaceae bacterium]
MDSAVHRASPSEPGDALIGRTVAGKYRIESKVGAGAMGAVYRGHQLALDKTVALKVLHRQYADDPTFVARFEREAKAATVVDHPNSMRVLDFGQDSDGLLYIVMEFLDGTDLHRVLRHGGPF